MRAEGLKRVLLWLNVIDLGLMNCIDGLDLRGDRKGGFDRRFYPAYTAHDEGGQEMVAKKTTGSAAREHRDLRYRNQYFPGAEKFVFDTARKGFVPLPIILRKILWFLTAAEVRVLTYLITRASRYGICYPTEEEIAHDLGMAGRKNLTPHLRALEQKHFIKTHNASGKKFFLIQDPRIAIERLVHAGKVPEDRVFEINELLEDLHQQPITAPAKGEAAKTA
jgi:hypothetical protein